ncbi:MAG TPA: hypothetical protein VFF09_01765 [archaeon]|nr:hypothetical protein [archaeon]
MVFMVLMNVLKGLVESQFRKKALGLALLFFALPVLLLLVFYVAFSYPLSGPDIAVFIVAELVYWALASVLLYMLLYAFKGKAVSGNFSGIFSAFSVSYLLQFIASALFIAAILIAIPGYFSAAASAAGQNLSIEDGLNTLSTLTLPSGLGLAASQVFVFLVAITLLFSSLYVFYRIAQSVKGTSAFSNLVFLLIFVVLAYFLRLMVFFASGLV